MDDNKSSGKKNGYGSYFYTGSDELNKSVDQYLGGNSGDQLTYNGHNKRANTRMISQGRPNSNSVNYVGNGLSKISRGSFNPLSSSRIDSESNSSNDSLVENNQSSSSKISELKNKVDDVSVKVKEVKNLLTFFKKYKIIILLGCIVFLLIILFMFLIMVIDLDDDNENNSSSSSYDEVAMNTSGSGNENLWYPIGSSDVTTSIDMEGNTVEFRSGMPIPVSVTSPYGERYGKFHYGVDLAATGDVYLIAMGDGEITYISNNRDTGYNNKPDSQLNCDSHAGMIQINIKYNNGYESRFLHVREKSIPSYLKVGSKVYQGQVVALMGNTGCSTGQHLHFELLIKNERVNPGHHDVSFLNPRKMSDSSVRRSEDILKDTYYRSEEKPSVGVEVPNGNDNKQIVCLTLKNYYSDNVVAGLMVNIHYESSFNPTSVVLDSNNKYSGGLFQWNAGRFNLLKSRYGSEWVLISNQIDYFRYEVANTEKKTASILNNTSLGVSDVSYSFCKTFERAANCSPRRSETLAKEYGDYVKNGCK